MVLSDQFISRLKFFAESFTGLPVRVSNYRTDREKESEKIQTDDFFNIRIPREIDPRDTFSDEDKNRLAYNLFKGLVALQASAASYHGTLSDSLSEKIKFYKSMNRDEMNLIGKLSEISPKDRTDYLRSMNPDKRNSLLENIEAWENIGSRDKKRIMLLDELDFESYQLLPAFFSTIELSRRMQCIKLDYPIFAEDIEEGFRSVFNSDVLKKSVISEQNTNEIDLAISRAYWENLGIDKNKIDEVCETIYKDHLFGDFRDELYGLVKKSSSFSAPLNSNYEDSLDRLSYFKDYMEDLFNDLGVVSPFSNIRQEVFDGTRIRSMEDRMHTERALGQEYERSREELFRREIEKKLERRERQLESLLLEAADKGDSGSFDYTLKSKDNIMRRLTSIKNRRKYFKEDKISSSDYIFMQKSGMDKYTNSTSFHFSSDKSLGEVPFSRIINPEIPKEAISGERGKAFYFPEYREGILEPKAVRVMLYDLMKNKPRSEDYNIRELDLRRKLKKLEQDIKECERKINSDISYIYHEMPEIMKKRDSSKRSIAKLNKELDASEKLHSGIVKKEVDVNVNVIKRIEREMERIKPAARSIVRNCFEGELDEKKYFEYWLQEKSGGSPTPNFFYQWQKRRRDVASVLLIDASNSVNRIAYENKSVLDVIKESVYYLVRGAESLEDRTAVMAYNGKGAFNSRIFILKDFYEDSKILKERIELLQGELNNRDGSAIRYASQYLVNFSAKTRFLFHLGDMQPSDFEIGSSDAFEKRSYEGQSALEDVSYAFRASRTCGIIPVGLCIRKPKEDTNSEIKIAKGGLNASLLAKLKEKKVRFGYEVPESKLRANFFNNYKTISDMKELPKALRDIYTKLSFGV